MSAMRFVLLRSDGDLGELHSVQQHQLPPAETVSELRPRAVPEVTHSGRPGSVRPSLHRIRHSFLDSMMHHVDVEPDAGAERVQKEMQTQQSQFSRRATRFGNDQLSRAVLLPRALIRAREHIAGADGPAGYVSDAR